MKLYEGMFLIEAGRAAREWEATEGEIAAILEKHGSTIRERARYDERKLAYPVRGARRGAYLLTYFETDPEAIAEINVDLNLSEAVLRSMILALPTAAIPEIPALGTAEPQDGPPPSGEDEGVEKVAGDSGDEEQEESGSGDEDSEEE